MKKKSMEADVQLVLRLVRTKGSAPDTLTVKLGGMRIADITILDETGDWNWSDTQKIDRLDDESVDALTDAITRALGG